MPLYQTCAGLAGPDGRCWHCGADCGTAGVCTAMIPAASPAEAFRAARSALAASVALIERDYDNIQADAGQDCWQGAYAETIATYTATRAALALLGEGEGGDAR